MLPIRLLSKGVELTAGKITTALQGTDNNKYKVRIEVYDNSRPLFAERE